MSVTSSQQLNRYYDLYRDTELIFTKENIQLLSLDPRQIFLKGMGSQWPCILNSTSFNSAKVIIGTRTDLYKKLSDNLPNVSLRFYFFLQTENRPLSFFINGRISAVVPYKETPDYAVAVINYTQRPPDDLLEILGKFFETNVNAQVRKELSVPLTVEAKRKLGIFQDEATIFIQNVPRHCILRELSFCGAKVALMGIAPFLKGKDTILKLEFNEPKANYNIRGIIGDTEEIAGRKDILLGIIVFDEKAIPMQYKMRINEYITSISIKKPGNTGNTAG